MVKLRSDQQRVKALLKETITLLCKNGLEYKSHFCVDALIGITLDEEDVFLVKISETVSDGKSVVSEAPVVQHPLPLHMPPAPSYDIQMMSDSRFPPAQTEPISLSTKTVIPTPPPPAHSAHRKSPTPRKQPTPQPLKNERKRRASSSPVRETAPSQPSNIPEQPTTTPGASSNASEHSNQSSLSNSMNMEHMEHERPNSVEREEPGLVRDIAIKDEFSASETENENEGPEQDMPLNMSKSSSSKESTVTTPTIPGCSGWDPAHLQQQVAQAAAAALSTGDSSTPPTPDMAKTPENGEQQDGDGDQWSMLKSALKTKQKGGRKPNEEDGVDFFYTIAQPQYSLEKRYVCDFDGCNYTSSRKYNLMRHGRTHHEDQRIPCPECPGTFVDKYILKEHMAAAHPKFTVPIEGTNMIGVGIGTTNMPTDENGEIKRRRVSQVGAPGQSRPEGSPIPGRRTPKQKVEQSSPGAGKRKSNGGGAGWHIPRLVPMDEAAKAEQRKVAAVVAATVISGEKGKEANNIPPREPAFINIEPTVDSSSAEANNNNNSKPYESSLSLASSMQAVFPGMDMMSLADDPDLTNNNNVKEAESVDPPSDLSAGMQVVFPGMEMVADDSNGAAEQDADDSLKDRSVIETSDGEEVKVSE